jgi:hypothetical protein
MFSTDAIFLRMFSTHDFTHTHKRKSSSAKLWVEITHSESHYGTLAQGVNTPSTWTEA